MDKNQMLDYIAGALVVEKEKGQVVVSIEALLSFLGGIKQQEARSPDNMSEQALIKQWELENNRRIAEFNAQSSANLTSRTEMFKSVIAYGQMALKSAMIINGGAAVALLAFIGNVWGKNTDKSIIFLLSRAEGAFAWGVLMAAIAIGLTYFNQMLYERAQASEKYMYIGYAFHVFVVLVAVASFLLFGYGIQQATDAFVFQAMKCN